MGPPTWLPPHAPSSDCFLSFRVSRLSYGIVCLPRVARPRPARSLRFALHSFFFVVVRRFNLFLNTSRHIGNEKADSLFGRKLDLPTLGVDLPSAEKLEGILPKGNGKGKRGGDLKGKLEGAKSKAQALARKAKDKKKNLKDAIEEKIKGGSAKEAGSDVSEPKKEGSGQGVVDVEAVAEEEEEAEEAEEESKGKEGETKESSSGEDDETESPPSSASLLRTPYFESTYCDGDLRVGRTGNGDMFVSIRA